MSNHGDRCFCSKCTARRNAYATHDADTPLWWVLQGATLRGGIARARLAVVNAVNPPPTAAKFEAGSCGHIATRCECDYAADLHFVPRGA